MIVQSRSDSVPYANGLSAASVSAEIRRASCAATACRVERFWDLNIDHRSAWETGRLFTSVWVSIRPPCVRESQKGSSPSGTSRSERWPLVVSRSASLRSAEPRFGLAVALGGAAVGLGLSVGGLAIGSVALGGAAIGFVYALGGGAFGPAIIDGRRCDPAALEFVRQWFGTSVLPPNCR